MANCRCGLTGGCDLCRPSMNVDWGDFYGGETAYPTNREKRVAHNVAVAEVCPNTLHPYTPYEVGAVQKLENAILRAFREAKL